MQGFSEKEAETFQQVKDAMAGKAIAGDTAAASAYAALVQAESERGKVATIQQEAKREEQVMTQVEAAAAANPPSWTESVSRGAAAPAADLTQ